MSLIPVPIDLELPDVPECQWGSSSVSQPQGHRSDNYFIQVEWSAREGQPTVWFPKTEKVNLWTIAFSPKVKHFPRKLPYQCVFLFKLFKITDGISYSKQPIQYWKSLNIGLPPLKISIALAALLYPWAPHLYEGCCTNVKFHLALLDFY